MDSLLRKRLRAWIPLTVGACGVTVLLVILTKERTAPVAPAVQSMSVSSPPISSSASTHTTAVTPLSSQGEAALSKGAALLQQHQLTEAQHAFEQAAQSDPRSPLAHDWLGMACEQEHRYPEALHQFQEEIRLQPDSGVGWARVADIHYARNDPNAAIQALERAVALNPDEAQFYFNLGMLYQKTMALSKSVEALNRCVALQPGNSYFQQTLGELLLKLARLDQAEQAFTEAIRIDTNVGTYHFDLAEVYLKREATPENTAHAKEELERALTLGLPEAAEAHYHLGQCYQRQADWEPARRELEIAVRMAPDNWAAYYALHEVALRQGRIQEASQALARFRILRAREDALRQRGFYVQEVERNPDSPDATYQLAAYLARTGEREEAKQALERSARLAAKGEGVPGLRQRIAALSAKLQSEGR